MGLIDYLGIFFYRVAIGFVGIVVFFVGVSIIGASEYTTRQGYFTQVNYNYFIAVPGLIVILLGIGIIGYAATRKQP